MSLESGDSPDKNELSRKLKMLAKRLDRLDTQQRQIINAQIDLALELAGEERLPSKPQRIVSKKTQREIIARPELLPEGWKFNDKFEPNLSKRTPERTRWMIEFLRTLDVTEGRVYFGGDHFAFKYKGHYVELDINSKHTHGRIFLRFTRSDQPLEQFLRLYSPHRDRRMVQEDVANVYDKESVIVVTKTLLEQI